MPQNSTQSPGFVSTVTSWFKNLFTQGWRFNFFGLGNREVLPDIDATKAVTEGFDMNAAVYSIVKRDIEKFAAVPRYLVDPKKLEEKRKKMPVQFKHLIKATKEINNKLTDLLNRPNPYEGQAAFLKKTRAFYKVCGETFIWLNRGDITGPDGRQLSDNKIDLMPVLEMYVLPAYLMKIVPDPDDIHGILGYLFNVGSRDLPLRKGDVIHWKDINLDFDATTRPQLRGMTPLRPGAAVLESNNSGTKASVRMYQNDGARAALANKSMNAMDPQQETQLRHVFKTKINNNDVKGEIAALQGDWSLLNFGKSAVDMDLLKGREMGWKELCFLLNVPYELFDSTTTYANKEQAQKGWIINSIIPASKEFDDELNRVLLKSFLLEGKAIIQCDYSDLPELQQDMAALTTWLMNAYWITPNEKREYQGLERYDDIIFDEPWMPGTIKPLSQMNGDGFDQMMQELNIQPYSSNGKQPTNNQPAN